MFEFLPEQHQNQHRVQTRQDKQPGHQRSMVEEITHGHIHCHVLLDLKRIQKISCILYADTRNFMTPKWQPIVSGYI